MYEVEVKIKLREKNEFIRTIKDLGAKFMKNLQHIDIYYNLPDGLRDFAITDEALRLRKSIEYTTDQDIDIRTSEQQSSDLTYKGPKLDKETKSRIEYVSKILDPEAIDNILMAIGFQKILTVEKNRRLYHLNYHNRDIELLVDQVQHLSGFYAEFEIMISEKEQMNEAKEIIFDLMNEIDYIKSDSITISYLELVILELIKQGKK